MLDSSGEATLRSLKDTRIGIIGLGYVGLPLAVEFGKHYPTVGFDIKKDRIAELEARHRFDARDHAEELRAAQAPRVHDATGARWPSATRSSSRCRRPSVRTTAPC